MQNIRQFAAALLALLLGIFLTAACVGLVYSQMQASGKLRWQDSSAAIAKQLAARLALQEESLHSIQAAFIAQPQLSRQQFNQLVLNSNLSIRTPAVLAMGFIRPVESQYIEQYIAKNRSDTSFAAAYYSNFAVAADSQRTQLQVLELVSPLNRTTAQWLGDDLSNVQRLKAHLEQARDRGQAWGAPMQIRGSAVAGSYAFYMPIYQSLLERPTVETLRNNYLGSVVMWLKLSELLADTERTAHASGLAVRLLDHSEPNQAPLYSSAKWAAATASPLEPQLINALGRQWRLEFVPLGPPINSAEYQTLLLLALIGLLLSVLLAMLIHYVYRRSFVLQQADTAAQQEMQHRLAHERQNHAILEAVSDPLVLRDTAGKITYANAVAEHRFGQTEQSIVGQSDALLDARELGILAMPVQLAINHTDRDGVARHYDVILKPLRDDHLNWIGTILHARDISIGSASIADLRYKLDRLTEMVEISSDWFWEQDAQARFTHVSGGFFAELDINPAVFMGKCRWELGAGGLSEAQWAAHRAVLAAKQPYRDFEYQAYLNNQTLYFSVSGRPVFNAAGEFVGYRGAGRNVTPMRNAQVALIEAQQRAQATLESIADGVLTTDIKGRIDYINPVASALLGWELEMARGQSLGTVYQSVDAKTRLPLANLVTAALHGGVDNQGARRSVLLNKLGLNFQIEESAARIRDEENRTLGAVLVFRDISNWRDEAERASVD
ncbi:PAS domain-containing protein [Deefgea rivuli]|uniref:PAS domain-containing protein n=1 Tax=Deefgea rivuli TaxID=400948 RepID=UPI0004840623|nr:PAS domain-containing protein [Deefgea rivuli]